MNEFKTKETPEVKQPEAQGFKEIKPQSDMNASDAKQYWDNQFKDSLPEGGYIDDRKADDKPVYGEQGAETLSDAHQHWDKVFEQSGIEGHELKVYLDDNGKKYREDDDLLPNKSFEVNGYRYETDDHGRPISAEGTLRIRSPEHKRNMDPMEAVGKGDQKEGDQRGHLMGYQFEGTGGIENLVAMDGKLNQGDYAKLENRLADAVKDGAEVRLKVEPRYEGESNRPTEFRVSYSIDGEKDVVVFKNGSDTQ